MDISQIDELKNRIIELSIQCISDLKTQDIPYNSFHFELQKLLAEKSVLFNFSSRREYPTSLNNKKYGFMDLVWLDGEKPVVAFEIDSRFYISSVWKLLNINADLRFWIYYNQMTEDELFIFRGKNKDKFITLVKLPVFFDIKPEEIKKIQNYYNRWKAYNKKDKVLKKSSYTFDEVRLKYPKAFTKWTIQDEEKLKELFLSGRNVEEIAKIFQRKVSAIEERLKNQITIEDFFE